MADDIVLPIPNLTLPQHLFTLSTPSFTQNHSDARNQLLAGIKADQMAPYYKIVTSTTPPILTLDEALLAEMEKVNVEELAKLDERLAEAEKTEGESEISDALKARANYLTRIGDKVSMHWHVLSLMSLIHGLGAITSRSEIGPGENPGTGFAYRHCAHACSYWLLLRRPPADYYLS